MGTENPNALERVYGNRIREPRTSDEVYGYWLFVAGILVGLLGLVLVIGSEQATTRRGLGVAILGLALLTLLFGSIIRLELQPMANYIAALGVFVGLVAIIWFWAVYPANWQFGTQQVWNVVGLGAAGIGLMVISAVIVPLVMDPLQEEHDTELAASEAARSSAESDASEARSQLDAVRESKAQFELYEDNAGEYRWRLRHRNSNIVADSGEGYASKQKAQQGLQSVKANAYGAAVVDIESSDADEEASASGTDGDDAPAVLAETESSATIEVYEDNAGEYRWRLRHDNGNVLGDSSEGYASRSNVDRALDSVRVYVLTAPYLSIDPVAFEVYEDAAGEYRWRLVHENGNILADSGQGYASRSGARDGAESVRQNADGGDAGFDVYEDDAGEYRWRLVHDNGEIIADSGEGYASESGADDAVVRIREYAADADLLAIDRTTFEIYEDAGDEWRWRLRHRNGNILADSGEGYASRRNAVEAVTGVKRYLPNAPVEDASD